MKKYSEKDIEQMLFKTEKTDATFDKTVKFPVNNIMLRRRRFASLLVAACLVVFIVSASLIVAFIQGDNSPDASEDWHVSDNSSPLSDVFDKSENDNSDDYSYNASFPYYNSEPESMPEYSDGDETRNPFGESDYSSDESDSSTDVSDDPNLPAVAYPYDNAFFTENGIGTLNATEYFESNPNKGLENRKKLALYSRKMLSVVEIKRQIGMIGSSFGINTDFDEELYRKTGDCVGRNSDNNFVVSVKKYGDWTLYSKNELLYIGARTEALYAEIQNRTGAFINEHRDIFGYGDYKITHKFTNISLEVYLYEITDDKITSETVRFVLKFDKVGTNDFYLKSIESNSLNMEQIGYYPAISYNEALKEFFKQPITEDDHQTGSESGTVERVFVGYDVRYLYSTEYGGMYPFYSFVIKFDPNGDNPRYKAFFVPAIESEYIILPD